VLSETSSRRAAHCSNSSYNKSQVDEAAAEVVDISVSAVSAKG
jgi:hypothetical protein